MAAPVGMVFSISPIGVLTAEPSLNNGAPWSDSPPVGADFSLTITGVPAGVNPPAVLALCNSYLSLPLPFSLTNNAPRFQAAYAPLLATTPTVASRW